MAKSQIKLKAQMPNKVQNPNDETELFTLPKMIPHPVIARHVSVEATSLPIVIARHDSAEAI